MCRSLALLMARCLNCLGRALVSAGHLWVHVPAQDLGEDGAPGGPVHPRPLERLRPDLPLTPTERALDRQLSDLDRKF
ncbi:DUF6059 family protein [Kitasatospora sp. NPDC056531]|uniref:DUF6059 family protein n=1 Tax=Kitasatospora sp. NPDC056531 TaxID=3345856 RepID=UPI0036D175EC